jgi:error-prone DNA polymerase
MRSATACACAIECEPGGALSLRLGFNYTRGLQRATADALVEARTLGGEFRSVDDLARRVSVLSRRDLVSLARIGALNSIGDVEHRRDALWQVEEAARAVGPLLRSAGSARVEARAKAPLRKMNDEERLAADYAGTGLTTGPHPMAYHRAALQSEGILTAVELERCTNRQPVSIAGCVIARQRPGTAKGFVFLSLEDESGIANVIITPDVFEANRLTVSRSRILRIDGQLQIQDGVVHVKGWEIIPQDI